MIDQCDRAEARGAPGAGEPVEEGGGGAIAGGVCEVVGVGEGRDRGGAAGEGAVCGNRPAAGEAGLAQKKLARSGVEDRRGMIEAKHPGLSMKRQCELLELPRPLYYHRPETESDENLALMRVIDGAYRRFRSSGAGRGNAC